MATGASQTEVEFTERDGMVVLVSAASPSKPDRAELMLTGLRFSAQKALSTDEIMQLTRAYEDD
jgi:hypothetical protein